MPWLAASRYQPRWRESRSRQMWLSLLADAAEVSIRWLGAERQTGGAKCQSRPGAERWTGQGCRWTSASIWIREKTPEFWHELARILPKSVTNTVSLPVSLGEMDSSPWTIPPPTFPHPARLGLELGKEKRRVFI